MTQRLRALVDQRYGLRVHWLGRGAPPQGLAHYAKIARLDALWREHAVAVPPGAYALPNAAGHLDRAQIDALVAATAPMLAAGPLIVRLAISGEDGAERSHAGEGLTIDGIMTPDTLPGCVLSVVDFGRGLECPCAVLVQQQVDGDALGVLALTPEGESHLELHEHAPTRALASGTAPAWAGPLPQWPSPLRAQLESLAHTCMGLLEQSDERHGVDIEFVVAGEQLWCVQLRPLTSPLFEGWPAFAAALDHPEQSPAWREGEWKLDAEHNPEPLSHAHIWLLKALRQARPGSGEPTAFAGWLYVRRMVRELATPISNSTRPPAATASPHQTLVKLFSQWLPAASERAAQMDARIAAALALAEPGPELAALIDQGVDDFLQMIDVYVSQLVPVRAQTRDRSFDTRHPLSTRYKAQHAQVLLARWDLASPSLAELGLGLDPHLRNAPFEPEELPTQDDVAATLLEECDDLLFAWGLAPLRSLFRAANAHLGWPAGLAFSLSGPELAELLRADPTGPAPAVATRKAGLRSRLHEAQSHLLPPLRLLDGCPAATAYDLDGLREVRTAQFALGRSCAGAIAVRADLQALLEAPPPPGSVLVMPTLTAAAALVLEGLDLVAVVTAYGGRLSHGVLVARELKLSALIGLPGAMQAPEGRGAHVDTQRRVLRPVSDADM